MKDKHTPGPWHVRRGSGIYAKNRYIGLSLEGYLDGRDLPYKANARLMAAAPELFEILEESKWYVDFGDSGAVEWYDKVEKLIAKIKGDESDN